MTAIESASVTIETCPACNSGGGQIVLEAPDRYHGRLQVYDLLQCPRCSLIRTVNPPAPTDVGQHYGSKYDQSVSTAGQDPRRWCGRTQVLETYFPDGGLVLDLGCSAGGFLAALNGRRWRRHGVEMSPLVAEAARKLTGAEIFVGDILDASFGPNTFDAITCFHVLEHMYHPREVLEKVANWLKPGGIFFVMVPNIDSGAARIFRSYWYALELPRHICHFSPGSLGSLSESIGFKTISITAHREMFLGESVRYLIDQTAKRFGLARVPLAEAPPPGRIRRATRKLFRVSVLPILSNLVAQAGPGESIHAIFQKPLGNHGVS